MYRTWWWSVYCSTHRTASVCVNVSHKPSDAKIRNSSVGRRLKAANSGVLLQPMRAASVSPNARAMASPGVCRPLAHACTDSNQDGLGLALT